MTPKRPQRLNWKGEEYPDGRPARYIDGIPARNLTAEETDALTQEQLSVIRSSGLYTEVAQPTTKSKPSTKIPEAAGADETTDAGDEPTETAEPVTQGGES
jgi:hypothetical protein